MPNPVVACRICGAPVTDSHLLAPLEEQEVVTNAGATAATEVPGLAGLCQLHRAEAQGKDA